MHRKRIPTTCRLRPLHLRGTYRFRWRWWDGWGRGRQHWCRWGGPTAPETGRQGARTAPTLEGPAFPATTGHQQLLLVLRVPAGDLYNVHCAEPLLAHKRIHHLLRGLWLRWDTCLERALVCPFVSISVLLICMYTFCWRARDYGVRFLCCCVEWFPLVSRLASQLHTSLACIPDIVVGLKLILFKRTWDCLMFNFPLHFCSVVRTFVFVHAIIIYNHVHAPE